MRFREYFEWTSIINLPERTDRRSEMELELERAGLSPEPGRIEFFPAIKVTEAAGFPNAGYHGCYRSHMEILKHAAAAQRGNVLVLEDDASFSRRFKQDEESLIDQVRSLDWGIIYFGHGLEGVGDRPGKLHLHPKGGANLTHFYAVNGNILERLVDFLEKILLRPVGHPDGGPMSPDGALHVFLLKNPEIKCFRSSPSMASQRSSRSDLIPKWFDKLPGLRQTANTLRKMKRWLK